MFLPRNMFFGKIRHVNMILETAFGRSLAAHRGIIPHRKFASYLGLSHSTAYRYEFAQIDVPLAHVYQVAHRLNCQVEVLLELPTAIHYDPIRKLILPVL